MWHIACIRASPLPLEVPGVLWLSCSGSAEWKGDRSVGWNGLGYIVADIREDLLSAAASSIRRFEDSTSPSNVRGYGNMLVLVLRQVVDGMRYLPAAANVAVAVARHVQRVCFERCGLTTCADVVVSRLEGSEEYRQKLLRVVGGFGTEGLRHRI